MNIVELDLDSQTGTPARKKRRPALACLECRRRKIRCDRRTPCGQCTKANIDSCGYICDRRRAYNVAPFEANETQFSVFEQFPLGTKLTVTRTPTNAIVPTIESPPEVSSVIDHSSTFHDSSSDCANHANISQQLLASESREIVSDLDLDHALVFMDLLQDESSPTEVQGIDQPLEGTLPVTIATSDCVRGTFYNGKFYGQSHWLNFMQPSLDVTAAVQSHELDARNRHGPTLERCRIIAKKIKDQEATAAQSFISIGDILPGRTTCDRFVQGYLRTFQPVLAIISISKFSKAYKTLWADMSAVKDSFRVTLLLVMSIGSTVYENEGASSRITVLQWISAASRWLQSASCQHKTTIDGIRVQCLYLLACQTNSVTYDTAWISTGSLLRMAMRLGLHIDPEKHPSRSFSFLEIQSRRKLWATVLEMDLQHSMDIGIIPEIGREDYYCDLPLNIDDAGLDWEGSCNHDKPLPKPMEQFTQSSLQILLMKTAPIRVQIAKLINSFNVGNSYDEILSLNAEFVSAMKTCTLLVEGYCTNGNSPTAFQTKIFDLFTQRFMLGLHHPFAEKAILNPSFYYSRKMCLEASLSLLSRNKFADNDDFQRLRLSASGCFYDVYTQAALFLCRELVDGRDSEYPFLTSTPVKHICAEMLTAINNYVILAKTHLSTGHKKVKCFVNVQGLLSQFAALQSAAPVQQSIAEALQETLETCQSLLVSQLRRNTSWCAGELHSIGGGLSIDERLDWHGWDMGIIPNIVDSGNVWA